MVSNSCWLWISFGLAFCLIWKTWSRRRRRGERWWDQSCLMSEGIKKRSCFCLVAVGASSCQVPSWHWARAWRWWGVNEGNIAAVEDITQKKARKLDLTELQVRKSEDLGRESRWVSCVCHRKRGSDCRQDRKTWILEMFLGLQLWWGSPEKPPANFFGSQGGKGWGCASRNQKMAQKMQFKQKNKGQTGLGKMSRFWVTLSFTVSWPCAKSAHEQSNFAGLCTTVKCSGNLKMSHCKMWAHPCSLSKRGEASFQKKEKFLKYYCLGYIKITSCSFSASPDNTKHPFSLPPIYDQCKGRKSWFCFPQHWRG